MTEAMTMTPQEGAKPPEAEAKTGEVSRKLWLAALGIFPTVVESGGRLFQTLVENGAKFEAQRKERMTTLSEKVTGAVETAKTTLESGMHQTRGTFSRLATKGEDLLDKKVAAALKRYGLPTRGEFERLTARLDELAAKLDQVR